MTACNSARRQTGETFQPKAHEKAAFSSILARIPPRDESATKATKAPFSIQPGQTGDERLWLNGDRDSRRDPQEGELMLGPAPEPFLRLSPAADDTFALGMVALTPELTVSLVEQMWVVQRQAGSAEVLLELRRDTLGGLKVRIRSVRGKVHAEFLSDDPLFAAAVEADLGSLLRALESRGVAVGEIVVRRRA